MGVLHDTWKHTNTPSAENVIDSYHRATPIFSRLNALKNATSNAKVPFDYRVTETKRGIDIEGGLMKRSTGEWIVHKQKDAMCPLTKSFLISINDLNGGIQMRDLDGSRHGQKGHPFFPAQRSESLLGIIDQFVSDHMPVAARLTLKPAVLPAPAA